MFEKTQRIENVDTRGWKLDEEARQESPNILLNGELGPLLPEDLTPASVGILLCGAKKATIRDVSRQLII